MQIDYNILLNPNHSLVFGWIVAFREALCRLHLRRHSGVCQEKADGITTIGNKKMTEALIGL